MHLCSPNAFIPAGMHAAIKFLQRWVCCICRLLLGLAMHWTSVHCTQLHIAHITLHCQRNCWECAICRFYLWLCWNEIHNCSLMHIALYTEYVEYVIFSDCTSGLPVAIDWHAIADRTNHTALQQLSAHCTACRVCWVFCTCRFYLGHPWNALGISPLHIIAHCTNHTAHCTAAFWHILHCMQGKLSMLYLQTTLWACQLHSFCDVHFTSVHCSMHNSHCAILGQQCANRTTHCISVWCKLYCRAKLSSPLQRRAHDQQQTKCFLRWHLTGVV